MAHNVSNQSLGDVVRDARLAKGWSLRDLAAKVGKTPSYLSDIENDRRVPAEYVLRALGGLLGLNFDDLMARAGRFGADVERYVRQTPAAGVLFRKVSEKKLSADKLRQVTEFVDELERKERRR